MPPYCGDSRVMSLMRPETVGSVASSSRSTAVDAPVCDELNTGSVWPTTVTVSATPATRSENSRSVRDAERQADVVLDLGLKPASAAVTL